MACEWIGEGLGVKEMRLHGLTGRTNKLFWRRHRQTDWQANR